MARRFEREGDSSIVSTMKRECVDSENKKVRNTSMKVLSLLASTRPEWLYSELDFFLGLLESEHTLSVWSAMDVVGHVAAVDVEGKIDKRAVGHLEAALEDDSMVTAAHGVENLARIAQAKPRRRKAILAALGRVEHIPRDSACREVLLGKVAESMGALLPVLSKADRETVSTFLERVASQEGERAGNKARKVLRKIDRGA